MIDSTPFVVPPVSVGSKRAAAGFAPDQLQRLHRALEPLHSQYDSAERALRSPFSSPGYHTTLTGGFVHQTRESLNYAVALLDTGDAALVARAQDIVRRIIAEQDQNLDSKTYGIWSWFLEEPLSKMSPPDWNWADFCGVALLQIALDHRDTVDPDLLLEIDNAIVHAANSIARRNVTVSYTNIAIMGSYVTLVASELFALPEMKAYAVDRIQRIHKYTMDNGGFTEFNSPTYTITAIHDLARLRLHAIDSVARELIEDLYRVAWEDVAGHFHPPTRQWAGPHSRSYSSLISAAQLAFIERSVQTPLKWDQNQNHPSIDEHRLPTPCPVDLDHYFTRLSAPRVLGKTFFKGPPPITASTYLHPDFALGTFSRGDLWNQRRSLIAYWGDHQHPAYLHLRCIHDHYDFAAAQFFSAQDEGRILAGVNFATDGGDTHINLDRLKEGRLRLSRLFLRFEFGGAAADITPGIPTGIEQPLNLSIGKIQIKLSAVMARFAGVAPVWRFTRVAGTACLDLVLYDGPERVIELNEIDAGAAFTLTISTVQPPAQPHFILPLKDHFHIQWSGLKIFLPKKCATVDSMQKSTG